MGRALDDEYAGKGSKFPASESEPTQSPASHPSPEIHGRTPWGLPWYPGENDGLGFMYQDGEYNRRCHGWSDNAAALKALLTLPLTRVTHEGFSSLSDPELQEQLQRQGAKALKKICQKPGGK